MSVLTKFVGMRLRWVADSRCRGCIGGGTESYQVPVYVFSVSI